MEENKLGEQPNENTCNPIGENQNNLVNEENEKKANEFQEGSLGKFKDAESLLTAYNNLQAEFTRKCQKLKEFEKQAENNENQTQSLFEKEDWQKDVVEFLNKNIDAKPYSKEISEVLMQDKELSKKPNALDIAWAKVIQKTYKKPDEVLDNNFIASYLSDNEEIKNQLLLDALKNVKQNAIPKVMGTNSGSISMPKTVVPKTIEEAKILASKLFE